MFWSICGKDLITIYLLVHKKPQKNFWHSWKQAELESLEQTCKKIGNRPASEKNWLVHFLFLFVF